MNQEQEKPNAYRLLFEKRGPIRYISHLDLTRAFHRAFSRAALPLKFSEGFSPHPKFSFALPLSVGTESKTEYADFALKPEFEGSFEEIGARLQKEMPAGITILAVGEQKEKFCEIAFASYEILLPHFPSENIFRLEKALSEGLKIEKKNKKGKWVEKDISQGIRSVTAEAMEEGIRLRTVLSASGENYLKPDLIFEALATVFDEETMKNRSIVRCAVYKEDMTLFNQ